MTASNMHAGFTVSSFFKNHNINTVFTLCGGHISPILVGCESEGIDIIEVRDEVSTVFAADATSRLTNSIGVPSLQLVLVLLIQLLQLKMHN